MDFSVREAIKYAEKGSIDKWVHKFLITIGNNKKLSKTMKNKGYWVGPKKILLSKLSRCCGPEENMKFREPISEWKHKISKIVSSIKKGWEAPPLIVWYMNGKLSIADGTHRFEALKKLGFKEYWVIIWFNNINDFEKNVENYQKARRL